VNRGEIRWADLGPPFGTRPVLIITRDSAIRVRRSVTVVGITRRSYGIPVEVPIGPEEGMRERSVINADNILTVSKSVIKELITEVSPNKMAEVEAAIKFALALR
jgi:mRNA interferase MazF